MCDRKLSRHSEFEEGVETMSLPVNHDFRVHMVVFGLEHIYIMLVCR